MNSYITKISNFYRLAKPGIIRGNAITLVAGYIFASRGIFSFAIMLWLVLGSSMIIGSSCVINNIFDSSIDGKMERTKMREMVNKIISIRSAWIYAVVLLLIGGVLLLYFTNFYTFLLGIAAWALYAFVYTYSKRKTPYSTLIGTVPGAIPPLAGYVAARNVFDASGLILFLILVCWQMPHFLAIALRRIDEYRSAKIPVLPIAKGIERTVLESRIFLVLFGLFCIVLGLQTNLGFWYLISVSGIFLYWLVIGFGDSKIKQWPKKLFFSSLVTLLLFDIVISIWRAPL